MWCFYRFEELDVFSLLISCWFHSNFLFSLGYYRLIYLRVTGMDDGLNIKERVCYVSQKVTHYLLCNIFLCCFNFKLFNAECAYHLTLMSASHIFLCGFCYVSSFLCFFFPFSFLPPSSSNCKTHLCEATVWMQLIDLFILISTLSFLVLSSTAVEFYDGHGKWYSSSCKWGSPCHIRKWKDCRYPWRKGMWECINHSGFSGRNFIVSFFVLTLCINS